MHRRLTTLAAVFLGACAGPPLGQEGMPSPAGVPIHSRAILANEFLQARWTLSDRRITSFTLTGAQATEPLRLETGHVPRVVLEGGRTIDLAALTPVAPVQTRGDSVAAEFEDTGSGLRLRWSVSLEATAHFLVQELQLTAGRETTIDELVFLDTTIDGARQVGQVDGSVVVAGDVFLGVEHPLAKNVAIEDSRVRCSLPRGNTLQPGQTWSYTSVFGVVEPGQLRRGFLAYLERRRPRPYRPYLHYNSWYHLNIDRPDHHMTEVECLAAIDVLGTELVEKRDVELDAFVWDDGWDDFDSLWDFHEDFPDGFAKLVDASRRFDVAQGVWMSPWGGYGEPKRQRVEGGAARGFETNENGFSMSGPKYRAAFRDICLKMMRENGVEYFKFDGMGRGNGTGAAGQLADDVDAVLELTRELREEDPDLYLSATVGTWASPFWTFYADSIWRQGGDTGFHGAGSERQRWITYRDLHCYQHVVQAGPLYPLNSLMLHGPCIGERANPAKMELDEASVADELWTFFGSGTQLQELYLSPHLLTASMWDELAAAARWSRAHTDVLVDTHWIGGDPGNGEIYGWGAWAPRGGIVVLRNPSDETGTYELELARDLELPDRWLTDYQLESPRPTQRLDGFRSESVVPLHLELEPFEVLVFEVTPIVGAPVHDAAAYRRRCLEREAARTRAARTGSGTATGGAE